ncbi:MAG: imidazole glycerol phosphate synthase subunit HisH [Candidatus Omnitrophica bacterium]|nr:imidazole glycerol phosphate synthase subunit HisH [Candidatus Omnitrophota bacterium]
MIAVIDYEMGNLGSVSKALEYLGGDVVITQKGADLSGAAKIVLPGVGAFKDAMNALKRLGLIEPLKDEIKRKKPYLGICLGYELLFERSEEGGGCEGLGILKGDVVKFSSGGIKVPQIGWNQVKIKKSGCSLFNGIEQDSFFYFVHSYYVRPKDSAIVAAATDYGGDFASMVWDENLYAVQFHPEKSQKAGLKFLENFMRL